jgi:hypothetical protein
MDFFKPIAIALLYSADANAIATECEPQACVDPTASGQLSTTTERKADSKADKSAAREQHHKGSDNGEQHKLAIVRYARGY